MQNNLIKMVKQKQELQFNVLSIRQWKRGKRGLLKFQIEIKGHPLKWVPREKLSAGVAAATQQCVSLTPARWG